MFYECDDQNCALDNPADCSNRTFQHAAIRYADHKARSCGFEVFNVHSLVDEAEHRPANVDLDCVHYEISNPMHSFLSIEENSYLWRNLNIECSRCTRVEATITF